jgi:hypothetical protein
VEATAPYNTNKQRWVQNAQDSVLTQGKGNGDNPFLQFSALGPKVSDGIYAYIDVGINPKATQRPSPIAFWGPNGGIVNKASTWAGLSRKAKKE